MIFWKIAKQKQSKSDKKKNEKKQDKEIEKDHELYLRKEIWDSFLERQIWHLGLVVLKHRKAAKAWHLRYMLMTRLSGIEEFIKQQKRQQTQSKLTTITLEDKDDNISDDEGAGKSN